MKLNFSSSYIVEELRNKKRQLIAKIYTKNGKSILRDIDGTKLGTCDSKENTTKDKGRVLIGYGNLLVALLFDYKNLLV